METLPIRLDPGFDLRQALEALACGDGTAAFVIAGIGTLRAARIRLVR
jgi:predicted DNA-binding protein with PD1-like motif